MPSSDVRDRLLQDFIDSRGGSAVPPSAAPAKKVEPLIDSTIETEGNHTWGVLTGHTGKYAAFKTHVYDDSDWSEDVRKFIPEQVPLFAYDDTFFRMAMAIDQGMTTFLWGPSGSGKDVAAKQYCALRRIPYGRITGKEGMTPDMVIGCTLLNEEGTYFSEGDAYKFCRDGGMLVLSEPAAMTRVMFALQSALEKPGHLSVPDHPDPDSRMLNVNDRTLFVMTSNVRGVGDNRSKHSATDVMDSSTINRIEATIYKPYMDGGLEKQILKGHFPTASDEFVGKCVSLGNMIRDAINKRQINADWSLRTMIPWIRMSLIYGNAADGMRTTYFDKLDDAEKGAVQGFWTAVGFDEKL